MTDKTPKYIRTAADLITSREAIREGFLQQALAKTERANPYVQRAQKLWTLLQSVEDIDALMALALSHENLRDDLITASGFSDKAKKHLHQSGAIETSLQQALSGIFSQSSNTFREEIVYRYLLTKGDSLGGEMRNWIGAAASQHFTKALRLALSSKHVEVGTAEKSGKTQFIAWEKRLLIFDVTPKPIMNNNIDLILLDRPSLQLKKMQLFATPEHYLACGELKGGIDPAGADEHWKTAMSALERISQKFEQLQARCPKLFFLGSAIETAMANELFARMQDGRLSYVANLTVNEQVTDLAEWLVTL